MNKHKNLYLFFAICIPVLMIVIVAFNLVFFRIELRPQYNFIYMVNTSSGATPCLEELKIALFPNYKKDANSKISPNCNNAQFYAYDFATKKSVPVTLDKVKRMKFYNIEKGISPDGYSINLYCNTSDIMAWGFYRNYSNDYPVCVRKGDLKQRLNINQFSEDQNETRYFYFIGWAISLKKN